MNLKIGTGVATGGDIFKLVWQGWFFGVLVIFLPITALGALASLFVEGDTAWQPLFAVLMIPFVAAMQGVFAGGLVLLGLKIRPPRDNG